MCIGCRMRRASDWQMRVMHEASSWDQNCFVTLTYGRDMLPAGASLEHRHFQLFMKRLRRVHNGPVRFYMCGEYGPLHGRPHYHACLFNVNFADRVPAGKSGSGHVFYDSKRLAALWAFGRVSVQDLTRETAGYCAQYIMKKALGVDAKTAYDLVDADGVVTKRRPEYAAMSLKPGIGAAWFAKYSRDVFPHDFCVADGVERRVPKYYDRLSKRILTIDVDDVEYKRQIRALASVAENTDERREVREKVHLARLSQKLRSVE